MRKAVAALPPGHAAHAIVAQYDAAGGGAAGNAAAAAYQAQHPAAAAPEEAPAPPPPPRDPRDAEYLSGIRNLVAGTARERADLERGGQRDTDDFGTMMSRLAERRGETLKGADVSHNRRGLFYSGILGKARGDIDNDFNRTATDGRRDLDRRADDRRRALEDIGTVTADGAAPSGFTGTGRAGSEIERLMWAAIARRDGTP